MEDIEYEFNKLKQEVKNMAKKHAVYTKRVETLSNAIDELVKTLSGYTVAGILKNNCRCDADNILDEKITFPEINNNNVHDILK